MRGAFPLATAEQTRTRERVVELGGRCCALTCRQIDWESERTSSVPIPWGAVANRVSCEQQQPNSYLQQQKKHGVHHHTCQQHQSANSSRTVTTIPWMQKQAVCRQVRQGESLHESCVRGELASVHGYEWGGAALADPDTQWRRRRRRGLFLW